jgi:hypothetical protein
MRGCSVNATPRPLYPQRLTRCLEAEWAPVTSLDGCGKFRFSTRVLYKRHYLLKTVTSLYIVVFPLFILVKYLTRDDPGCRAILGVGLRPLNGWDCGFQSGRLRGCLSLVNVVFCQVEIFATGRSLVQRSPTDCSLRSVATVTL